MRNALNERRVKVFNVSPQCLLRYLRSMEKWPQYIVHEQMEKLPDDAELLDIRYDESRRCLGVLVFSASFPEVEDGDELPRHSGLRDTQQFLLIRQDDGNYREGEAAPLEESSWRNQPPLL